jgi:hypothetical protein
MRLAEFLDGVPDVGQEFDLFICATLGETRSTNVIKKYTPRAALNLVFLDERGDPSVRLKNLEFFNSSGFEVADDTLLREKCRGGHFRSVLVDISCMSRSTMASVVHTLISESVQSFQLNFIYSQAAFIPPKPSTGVNHEIEPVHENCAGWPVSQSAPTSLIIGLGYEPSKAEGASEFLDPSEQWAFIPTSKIPQYLSTLARNNNNFIKRLEKINRTIKYDLHHPSETFGLIELVVTDLLGRSNPVLLPFGPKIFFILCLLSGLIHPEIGIWHVKEMERDKNIANVDASGEEIGFMVVLNRTLLDEG